MELTLPINTTQEKLNIPHLTRREYEILHMAIVGFSNEEIQRNIDRTSYSVKWRLANIYHKFGAADRVELIKLAAMNGLCFVVDGTKKTYSLKVDAIEHEVKSAATNRSV